MNSNLEAPYLKYLIHHFINLFTCILYRDENSSFSCGFFFEENFGGQIAAELDSVPTTFLAV